MNNKVLRTKLKKDSGVRFISHLNFMKTISRALRRAELPIKFSEGFNPKPRISYGSALAVGMTSDGEYADFEFEEQIEEQKFINLMNDHLPEDISILNAKAVSSRKKSLMAVIDRSVYEIDFELEADGNLKKEDLEVLVSQFLCRKEIKVIRKRKKGKREVDLRPMIYKIKPISKNSVEILVRTGSRGNVRPSEFIAAFARENELCLDYNPVNVHRKDLLVQKGDKLISPLEI